MAEECGRLGSGEQGSPKGRSKEKGRSLKAGSRGMSE